MKKTLLAAALLSGLYLTTTSSTCSPEPAEPELKDYTCKCVYVSSDTTQPNKEETSTFKSKNNTTAMYDCNKLSGNYVMQGYSGSCNFQ